MLILNKVNNRSVKRAIDHLLAGISDFNRPVFIKPNWGGRLPIIKGENTDTLFLKILTDAVIKKGAKKVYIGHYPLLKIGESDYSFNNLLKITGVSKLKFATNVEFLNLENVEKEIVSVGEFIFHIPKLIKDVFYIDLAKMKTHVETKVSLCMKNQMGMLPAVDKISLHKKDLENGIALLATKLKPDLCIIDGIVSMDRNGPHHGRARNTNVLVCSDNLLEVDYLGAYLMGYNPGEIRHINIANDLGVGKFISNQVVESYAKFKFRDFDLPEECMRKFGLNIWPTTACSQCIFNLAKTQRYIKRFPGLLIKLLFSKKDNFNIVIGKGENIRNKELSKIIAIGDCSINLAKEKNVSCLRGCPPRAEDIINFIKDSIIK